MSWPTVKLGEVCEPVRRQIAPDSTEAAGLRYVGLEHVEPQTGVIHPPTDQTVLGNTFVFDTRHALYGKLRPYLNKVALPDFAGRCSTELIPLLPSEPLDRRYLGWFLRQRWVADAATAEATGSRMPRAVLAKLLDVTLPLPPVAEQRRIVARVDAIAGRLTEAMRLRAEADAESDVLLASERNRLFERLANSISPTPMGGVAACRLGKMVSSNRADENNGVPYLRNANIRWDQLDLSSVYRIVVSERERSELALQPGDILACEGRHLGKSAIWNGELPECIFQKALHRIRVDQAVTLPRFILHHMAWSAWRGDFDIHSTSTIPHLTGVMLKRHPMYHPPLAEQRRIVAHLDAVQAKADALQRLQAEAAAELDALLPAVLDKAFAGEL